MTRQYSLDTALLADGWARGVLVSVTDDGLIAAVDAGPAGAVAAHAEPERVRGVVVPGMANAHSHAFQRAMAGRAEYQLSARDSFWTWRQAMYALANRVGPDDLRVIATQLFIEMLKAGYTTAAEFHYLHRRENGTAYQGANALWDAVTEAAAVAGIGLTFLPTLYQTSDFGGEPLKREQARFHFETAAFVRAVGDRLDAERHAKPATLRTGAAFHSLRAVPLEALREATQALRSIDPALPLHIHVAEQQKEVEACGVHTGRRPIELLLETGLVDANWCLVHATHATADELRGIAASGASVCVSITTEANLGDGFFEAERFLRYGGRLCVGSDSQATVSPAEELRWMEYQQRLRKQRRSVLASASEPHPGTRLWRHAAEAGAHAVGGRGGVIAAGRSADWIVLDAAHPALAGAALEQTLDQLLFAGGSAAIRDVMVAGRWVVKDGHHAAELPQHAPFSALMARLGAGAAAQP